ncbi:MAG: argininosuccinate synthase [Legionellales bacterium]|nr:argininosuccinate synthase [Legionellales bacterium]
MSHNKIVLAYSGGLDTSVAISWLQEQYQYSVIALAVDVGEGKDLQAIKQKALAIGAQQCYVLDVQQSFAENYLAKALRANALYENTYPLISALSRPLISQKLVEIARQENATAIAHGCTGKGNDQVRFDVSINTLAPDLKIVAPVREHPMSREQAIEYAKQRDIPLPIQLENPFSIDLNLWGRSCECGVLEDPWAEPPSQAYAWTCSIDQAPETGVDIELTFHQGIPTALNGQPLPLHQLISTLNQLAGEHGIGRIDHVENRLVGIKSREIYEAPAAMTLIKAHQALEALCLPREVAHFKPIMEQKFANLVYEGLWHSSLFSAVDAFLDHTQKTVNGVVRIRLHKGNIIITGRQSKQSLYQLDLATYKAQDAFDHQAATGFIQLWGLPSQIFSQVNQTS